MKSNEFHQTVLEELNKLNEKIDIVRTQDVPELKAAVAGFRSEIDSLKTSQTWSTRLYTVAGGALAVIIAKFTGGNH